MVDVILEQQVLPPVSGREVEYVERKGIGHPDTICDGIMESLSLALCRAYIEVGGQVLHYNLDKGLLVAGKTAPKLGGGTVEAPMRLVIGDRATAVVNGQPLPLDEIIEQAARAWCGQHLRFVDPAKHLTLQNELQPGSVELTGVVNEAGRPRANDTSAAVGFAPLSETEHLVFAAEHFLNSPAFKSEFPETGEDVKVMGVRRGRRLQLTVAIAFVDHFIWEEGTYFRRKEAVAQALTSHLQTKLHAVDAVDVEINALDVPGKGAAGMYLTVLGTSAESGDSGEVGRGNRVNGLISLCRPMTLEAAAGKNAVCHVGKVYNLLAHQMADRVYDSLDAVEEAYVWLCSRIGGPLDEPWSVSAQVSLAKDAHLNDVAGPIEAILREELADIEAFTRRVTRGELHVC